jgi:hypothetical protein
VPLRDKWQCPNDPLSVTAFVNAVVGFGVNQVTMGCSGIVGPLALQVDQSRLTGAVDPVLERGDGHKVIVLNGH